LATDIGDSRPAQLAAKGWSQAQLAPSTYANDRGTNASARQTGAGC
jgi:hypothetical protein